MKNYRRILIENEDDLQKAALFGNHSRKEYILNALTYILVFFIIIIPTLFLITSFIYGYHLYTNNEWGKIEFYLIEMAKLIVYIGTGFLIQMKIMPKNTLT